MKMPFLLIRPKIVLKNLLIKKGGCFEYHAVIADKIEYPYVHRASICPALGMDRRSFFMPKTMGKYKRLEVFYLSKPVYAADKPRLCLFHGFRLNAKRQILRLGQAVVALGKLAAQHGAVLRAHRIEMILLVRNTHHLLKIRGIRSHIHKRKLKADAGIKEV